MPESKLHGLFWWKYKSATNQDSRGPAHEASKEQGCLCNTLVKSLASFSLSLEHLN